MPFAALQQTVMVFMTPKDLREIADRMEQHWAKTQLGESLTAYSVAGQKVRVEFIIDQERMRTEVGPSGKARQK